MLDQIRLARHPLDFVDALLTVAVTQANIDTVMRNPALQRAYATYDAIPPDDLRRPISVNALAHSLGLPFETVRRRTSRLALLGFFKTSPEGIYVPGPRVQGPWHRRVVENGYERTIMLYRRLADLEAFLGTPDPSGLIDGQKPLRAAARIASEYLLRMVDLLTNILGSPVDAAIWLEVLRSGVSPEGERVAVRPALAAKRLGLPAETVRRRIAHLEAMGIFERARDGVLISYARLSKPDFAALLDKNIAYMRRMFMNLSQVVDGSGG